VKFEGQGEADDAGPGDADIGVVHGISLVGRGELQFGSMSFAS
jgi:hypothetical protein